MGIVTSSLFNEIRIIPIATGRGGGNEKFNNGDGGRGGTVLTKELSAETRQRIKPKTMCTVVFAILVRFLLILKDS